MIYIKAFIKFIFISFLLFIIGFIVGSMNGKSKWKGFLDSRVTPDSHREACGKIDVSKCLVKMFKNRINEMDNVDFFVINTADLTIYLFKLNNHFKDKFGKDSIEATVTEVKISLALSYLAGRINLEKVIELKESIESKITSNWYGPLLIIDKFDLNILKKFEKVVYTKVTKIYQTIRKTCNSNFSEVKKESARQGYSKVCPQFVFTPTLGKFRYYSE
jgi:hypothetical protein